MITEMEKVDFILRKGIEDGTNLVTLIKREIEKFESSPKRNEMLLGNRYYLNDGDVKDKRRTYVDCETGALIEIKHLSNFKLKHPLPHKMANQKAGYLLKKKMTIKQLLKDNEKEDITYIEYLKDIFNNRTHKMLKNTLLEAVNKGISWWQIYIDEEGKLKAKLRYAEKIVALWHDDEHESLDAIILIYNVLSYEGTEEKIIKKVEYWDLNGVRYLVYDGSNLIDDIQRIEEVEDTIIQEDDGNGLTLCSHYLYNGQKCNWTRIPFVYFKYNSEERPLIHYLKELVDCYDYITSTMGDSIKDMPDGVNVVKNYGLDIKTFTKNLNTFNTVFLEEDGDFNRKATSLDSNSYKEFIDRLRKDIFEAGSSVDTQSDKFGTQQSGVALEQLYNDLDLDCSNIETEFQSGLEYYLLFVNDYAKMINNKDYSDRHIEFIFNKSMITNESEKITNCKSSEGQVSQKTILANHPFVSDVEAEIKELEKEEEKNMGSYMENISVQNKETEEEEKENKDGDVNESK